jgi:hypothetical protein
MAEGETLSQWIVPTFVRAAMREGQRREAWIHVERRERVATRDEGGFRSAPDREVEWVITHIQWIEALSTGRKVLGVLALVALGMIVCAASLVPLGQTLYRLVIGP